MPVLWDREAGAIVNDESLEIIRMFNSAFDRLGAAEGDYYPPDLRAEIDALNARIYATVNNGVYRAGFATTPAAYEEAFRGSVRDARLARGEARATNASSAARRLTEADWRLFTTLIRFDPVYSRPLQVQFAGDRRLSRLAALPARTLPFRRQSSQDD